MRPVILLIALLASLGEQPAHAFGAPWEVSQTDGLCVLEQPVRDFGNVRFVGAPGESMRLEVLGHRAVFAEGPVTLYRVTPPWHPQHPQREVIGETSQRAGSALLIGEPLATRTLMALYEGYEAHLQHRTWYGGSADIRIGNEYLRASYETFARCLQDATARGWSAFERTRIEYPSDDMAMSDADRERLAQVAEYVLADGGVTHVYVDGHTDDVGAERANLLLSRKRAKAVADYLAHCGVPRARLVVRYHGSQYPVSPGDSDEARARNRRTTVRLEREWPDADVATR